MPEEVQEINNSYNDYDKDKIKKIIIKYRQNIIEILSKKINTDIKTLYKKLAEKTIFVCIISSDIRKVLIAIYSKSTKKRIETIEELKEIIT
jgi:2-hydroxy-3-keto-5-methylthiopentenyl-1-phosphate phosphatase